MSIELVGWKTKRADKRAENHWATRPITNGWQEYQREWNFIETDYSDRPSNNGLDLMNPGFAFTTNLAKYLPRRR